MDINFIPTVFFTLFFVVDPLGLIPVFIVYLNRYEAKRRNRIILKSVIISVCVSIFFVVLGSLFLNFLGISSASFLIAGGIALFMISIDMIFGSSSRGENSEDGSSVEAENDVSIFPLAIPMLCGPGNIAALLMFTSRADGDVVMLIVIIFISVVVFAITMLIMIFSVYIERLLGDGGVSVIQRVMGLILSALAVQFVINGLKQTGIV